MTCVVVGSENAEPVLLAQAAHRFAPAAAVVLLTTGQSEDQVRRAVTYAPGVPLDLLVLGPDAELLDEVTRAEGTARRRREHQALLEVVATRAARSATPASAPGVALGALLEHAPLAVIICDAEGRVLGANRRAEGLLGSSSPQVESVLPGAMPLVKECLERVPGAVRDNGGSTQRLPVLVTRAGAEVEVTALPSRLDDGRSVVLLLALDITERRVAERQRDRLARHVTLLSLVSESLTATLDASEALHKLAGLLVPTLCDWISIQLADESGRVRQVVLHHRDPGLAEVAARARKAIVGAARVPSRIDINSNEVVELRHIDASTLQDLVPDPQLQRWFAELGTASAITVPLPGRETVLGSAILVNGPDRPPLTTEEATVAAEVGRRAGAVLENARLYGQQYDLATELQRTLLTAPPQPEHLQIAVRYVAAARAAQVGGDWYDAFVQPTGATILVIGDVVGHDTRAAAGMSQLRGVLRGIGYTTNADPAEVLTRVDEAIEGLGIGTTATAVVARLEQTPDQHRQLLTTLTWSNAGHPPPVLLSPDGAASVLQPAVAGDGGVGDMLLGVDATSERSSLRTLVPPGATVLLYTDGLIERRGQSLEVGIQALLSVVESSAGRSLDEVCDRVISEMRPERPDDDVALVAVRVRQQPASRQ
nr:SpoIIE family protein phosphatase [Motilibacter aurantiacus]